MDFVLVAFEDGAGLPARRVPGRMVWSPLPVASRLPSGAKATTRTHEVWLVSCATNSPLRVLQTRPVWSLPAPASHAPSGEKARALSGMPKGHGHSNFFSNVTASRNQMRSRCSPAAIQRPSGDHSTPITHVFGPVRLTRLVWVGRSQTSKRLSSLRIAMRSPRGENAAM
jgi:hypothetical protein